MLLPFGWADVASVGGEEPVVPVKVAGTVLALAVHGIVKVFDNRGASRLRSVVVRVTIGDEHGKRLDAVSQFSRSLLAGVLLRPALPRRHPDTSGLRWGA